VLRLDVIDDTYFHSIDEHSGETERNSLGIFLSVHGYFETISKIDVNDFSGVSV
jgi:hypothetical protein